VLYRQLLGSEFDRLPPVLRDLHGRAGRRQATGTATLQRLPGLLPRIVGFPPSTANDPVLLEIVVADDHEVWIRRFANTVRRSVQRASAGSMVETFGLLRLQFHVTAVGSEIRYTLQRASFLGLPLPLQIQAAERALVSSWEFEVTVAHIGSYRGRMELIA
jgi:hypothetical protein